MKKASIFLLVFLLTGTVLYRIALGQARQRLIAFVEAGCEGCKLELETIRYSPLAGTVSAHGSHFSWGDPQATAVAVDAPEITASLNYRKLLQGDVRLRQVEIVSPRVVVTEGPIRSPRHPERSAEPPAPGVAVEGTRIVGGSFTYVRLYGARSGVISVSEINASVGPWGTDEDLVQKTTEAVAEGLLEKSGRFRLKLTTPVFAQKHPLEVVLELAGQRLPELNEFFLLAGGIRLSGTILRAKSSVLVQGHQLKGSSEIQYKNLDIHFEKYRNRGAFAAFLGNIGKSLTIGQNLRELQPREKELTAVELHREQDETLIQFILHGMKDSALKVTALRVAKPRS